MAGQVKVNQIQLGDSLTPTQNFVWQTNVDGTAKLARGNVGSTTQDILTVDANGRIAMPQSVVAFSAYRSSTQSITSTTQTILQADTKIFDTIGAFNNSASPVVLNGLTVPAWSFMPNVPGYYSIETILAITGTSVSAVVGVFYKNGVQYSDPLLTQNSVTTPANFCFRDVVYLNGTTDYVSTYGQINGTTPGFLFSTVNNTSKFSAILIAKA